MKALIKKKDPYPMTLNKYLIIDADDFGLTMGITKGILRAMKSGNVTETNIITTVESSMDSLKLARRNGLTKIGIHLNLDIGQSLYYKRDMAYLNDYKNMPVYYTMMENEFFEQMEFIRSNEMDITHITSHKNIFFDDLSLQVLFNLAKHYSIPVRRLKKKNYNRLLRSNNIKMCDKQLINKPEEAYSFGLVGKMLSMNADSETTELICHPGMVTDELYHISSMTEQRQNELSLFTNPALKGIINEMGYELTNYSILKE